MKNINNYIKESILDDEDDVLNNVGNIAIDNIKNTLNTAAHFELKNKNIKILHSNFISPTSNFITLKDYTFEDIPNFEVGTNIEVKDNNILTNYIDTTNLLNSAWIKLWPHIKHIGKMCINLYNYNESELDLTDLNIDSIDKLVIKIRKVGTTSIRIKGPKHTKIKQVNFDSLLFSIIRPHLITGFNCKRIIFSGQGDTIKGIRANTINNADIYNQIEFDELERYNNIEHIIYNTKLNKKELFYILYKEGKEWSSKKSSIKY